MSDFDVNEADARAAQAQIVRTICRYVFATLAVLVACVTHCATSPEYQSRGQITDQLHEARGALDECRRWTQ